MTDELRRALDELMEKRGLLTEQTYQIIIRALESELRRSDDPDHADEIRLVTVMFIDVVNSTEMAQQVGNDEWKALIGSAHKLLANTVKQWDGEVGQYLGDGLLCFFGARHSRGNDAVRAVSCALAVQTRAREYAIDVETRYETSFALRVGISTGRVVVGTIGTADKSETLAVGATTNLAARLQSLAPPGGIVIDATTFRRVRTNFTTEAQDPVSVKGFKDPVPYYMVAGQRQQSIAQLTTDHIGALEIPFVGRDIELNIIVKQMDEVQQVGGFRAVTITGEIGLGKSRLMQEASLRTDARPYQLLNMNGHYERRETSFGLLRDLLETTCNLTEGMQPEHAEERILRYICDTWDAPEAKATAEVVGYLAGYGFADSPYTEALRRTGGEDQGYEWLVRWFSALATDNPLMIVVDDAQLADPSSIRMLERFTQVSGRGVLLLVGARPEFRQQYPRYLSGHANHMRITLEQLSEASTGHLIRAIMAHVDDVPEALPTLISSRAEGNPLFVEEFLRMLFDNGVFEKTTNDRFHVNMMKYLTMASALPNGLLGVLQARLDDLLGSARRVVQIASVVGQTFWDGAVETLADFDASETLASLVARGLIVEKPESRFAGTHEYRFRNTLYHEVAYEMLTRAARTDYHRQVAAWLNERVWDTPDLLDTLAEHYVSAGEHERALETYVAAVEAQMDRGQLSEALNLVETGLASARTVPREAALPLVSRLWMLQARLLHARRRYSEATATSQTALMLMGELPEDTLIEERVTAATTLGNAHCSLGNYEEALEALTQAYQYFDSTGKDTLQSMVLRAFGQLFWVRGSLEEAALYEGRALRFAQEGSREKAAVLSMLGRIARDKGDMVVALRNFESVLRLNRAKENLSYLVMDLRDLAEIYRNLFDYKRALAALDEAEKMRERIHHEEPLLDVNRGLCMIGLGKHRAGLKLVRQAAARDYPNAYDRNVVQLLLLHALSLTGHDDECVQLAESFSKVAQQHNPVLYGRGLLWQGLSMHKLGAPNALRTLGWALDNEQSYGGRDVWMCHYALSLAHKDSAKAQEHAEKAKRLLAALAANLHTYPELRKNLLRQDPTRVLFNRWIDPPEPLLHNGKDGPTQPFKPTRSRTEPNS